MKSDRKPVSSKLFPFAADLLALNDAGKKLPEIQEWLEARGMSASVSCISNFLTRLRTARARKRFEVDEYRIEYMPKLKAFLARTRMAGDKASRRWKRRVRR